MFLKNKFNKYKIMIYENIIYQKEKDLDDQVKNLESENNKSKIVIWFVWTIILFTIQHFRSDLGICYKVVFFVLAILSLSIPLYNIYSKSVSYHLGLDKFFNSDDMTYEKYLNELYILKKQAYYNVTELLKKKVILTKISYVLAIILLLYIMYISFN